jgi:hypothetical protein
MGYGHAPTLLKNVESVAITRMDENGDEAFTAF